MCMCTNVRLSDFPNEKEGDCFAFIFNVEYVDEVFNFCASCMSVCMYVCVYINI